MSGGVTGAGARSERRPEEPPPEPSRPLFQNTPSDDESRCAAVRQPAALTHVGTSVLDDDRSRWFYSNFLTVERTQTQAEREREPPPLSLSHACMTAAYAELDNEARVYY